MTRTMMLDVQELRRPARNAARLLALLCALAAAPRVHAQNVSTTRPQPSLSYVQGSEAKITGYIISRNGDSLLVQVAFFFNDTASTEIYTLPLHDAFPICRPRLVKRLTRVLGAPKPPIWG